MRSLIRLNEATNLKLGWDLLNNNDSWATLLKNRVLRSHGWINYHIFSTIWTSMKSLFLTIHLNFSWSLESGRLIKFWKDSWCGLPLLSHTSQDFLHDKDINANVVIVDLIFNRQWSFSLC